ncbi:MAG: SpoIID/LytB domain-containing protein [Planctomycetes bacterium]|nr:SpoIID/LytB domain-containing protein [Planctomycetota bacterium]
MLRILYIRLAGTAALFFELLAGALRLTTLKFLGLRAGDRVLISFGAFAFATAAFTACQQFMVRDDENVGDRLTAPPYIRVALSEYIGVDKAKFSVSTSAAVHPIFEGDKIADIEANKDYEIRIDNQSVTIGRANAKTGAVRIVPREGGVIVLENEGKKRSYEGILEIRKGNGATFTLINRVNLESYLVGVLPAEMPLWWHDEALKAQSVAARSYAFYQLVSATELNPTGDYDVQDTVADQVYSGLPENTEHALRARAIVESTRGIVVGYRRNEKAAPQLVLAFFHSNSGGRTAPASVIFPDRVPEFIALGPLKGVEDEISKTGSATSGGSERCEWWRRFTPETIQKACNDNGFPGVRDVKNVSLDGAASHTANLKIEYADGTITIATRKLRAWLGGTWSNEKHVPSPFFEVSREGAEFVFHGWGYGHGVGLSQYGARYMAEDGSTFDRILRHYYDQSEILRIY